MACESGRTVCTDCEESYPEESIFQCETCQLQQEPNLDNVTSGTQFYCDSCIVRHCKKGHKIMDSVSQPVLVCEEHKFLLNTYCRDCDILLCLKCLQTHNAHKLLPIETRAKEIRILVFEQLTNFEDMEKPARKQKDQVLGKTNANREKMQKLIKAFEETQQRILSELNDADKKSETAVELIVQKQSELRGLLSLSCQQLVYKWKDVGKRNEELGARMGDEGLLSNDGLQDFAINLSDKWFGSLGLPLKCVVTDIDDIKEFHTDTWRGKLYVVAMKGDSIELSKNSINREESTLKFKIIGTIDAKDFSCSIESIELVYYEIVILYMSDGSIMKADFDEKSITKCETPTQRVLLRPYFNNDGQIIEWIYWEDKFVRITENDKFKQEFRTKPRVAFIEKFHCYSMEYNNVWCILLNPAAMIITLLDFRGNILARIPQSTHGYSTVDFISCASVFNVIILWSIKDKSVTIIHLERISSDEINISKTSRVNWADDLKIKQYKTTDERTWYFLPAILLDPSSDNRADTQTKTIKWGFMYDHTY